MCKLNKWNSSNTKVIFVMYACQSKQHSIVPSLLPSPSTLAHTQASWTVDLLRYADDSSSLSISSLHNGRSNMSVVIQRLINGWLHLGIQWLLNNLNSQRIMCPEKLKLGVLTKESSCGVYWLLTRFTDLTISL